MKCFRFLLIDGSGVKMRACSPPKDIKINIWWWRRRRQWFRRLPHSHAARYVCVARCAGGRGTARRVHSSARGWRQRAVCTDCVADGLRWCAPPSHLRSVKNHWKQNSHKKQFTNSTNQTCFGCKKGACVWCDENVEHTHRARCVKIRKTCALL